MMIFELAENGGGKGEEGVAEFWKMEGTERLRVCEEGTVWWSFSRAELPVFSFLFSLLFFSLLVFCVTWKPINNNLWDIII